MVDLGGLLAGVSNKIVHLDKDKEILRARLEGCGSEMKSFDENSESLESALRLGEANRVELQKLIEDLAIDEDLVGEKWSFLERAMEACVENLESFEKGCKIAVQKLVGVNSEKIQADEGEFLAKSKMLMIQSYSNMDELLASNFQEVNQKFTQEKCNPIIFPIKNPIRFDLQRRLEYF
jgi:hypothetical protein